jgi:hypothetical protein
MKGFWGFFKGSMIIVIKAYPRLWFSFVIGAVRGAVKGFDEEQCKIRARIDAFQTRYLEELEKSNAR